MAWILSHPSRNFSVPRPGWTFWFLGGIQKDQRQYLYKAAGFTVIIQKKKIFTQFSSLFPLAQRPVEQLCSALTLLSPNVDWFWRRLSKSSASSDGQGRQRTRGSTKNAQYANSAVNQRWQITTEVASFIQTFPWWLKKQSLFSGGRTYHSYDSVLTQNSLAGRLPGEKNQFRLVNADSHWASFQRRGWNSFPGTQKMWLFFIISSFFCLLFFNYSAHSILSFPLFFFNKPILEAF